MASAPSKAFYASLRRVSGSIRGVLLAAAQACAHATRARKGILGRGRAKCMPRLLQGVCGQTCLEQDGDVSHIHGHIAMGATPVTSVCSMMNEAFFFHLRRTERLSPTQLNPAGLLRRKMEDRAFVQHAMMPSRLSGEESGPPKPRLLNSIKDSTRVLPTFMKRKAAARAQGLRVLERR